MSTNLGQKLTSKGLRHNAGRHVVRVVLCTVLFAISASATAIQYDVITNGTTGTYHYFVTGFVAQQSCPNNPSLQCSNAIDIQFDPAIFSQLSNAVAPAGFDVLLFQPNNPPSAPGDYNALAIASNPSLAGPFSVDFTLVSGQIPGSQTFLIESFDANNLFQGFAEPPGFTAPRVSDVPEPTTIGLGAVGLLLVGLSRILASPSSGAGKPRV